MVKPINFQGKYSLQATNIDGFCYVKHFPNHWELAHYCSRLSLTNLIEVFIITPDVKYILVYSTLKGVNKMQDLARDPFEQFAEENASKYSPFLDGKEGRPTKDLLTVSRIPFRILSTRLIESTREGWENNIWYEIQLDTQHPRFTSLSQDANLESVYTLSQPASKLRIEQLKMLEANGYVGENSKRVILQKFGKAYDFRDAQAQGLY